jgi:hypothetical protein
MNDFPTLTEAFTELERRADAVSAARPPEPMVHRTGSRPRPRLLLVAASVVAVSTVAVGTTLLTRDDGSSGSAGTAGSKTASHPSPTVARTFQIPTTAEDLAQRFRTVLAGTATFTVTETGHAVTVHLPAAPSRSGRRQANDVTPNSPVSAASSELNGAALVGLLTASGVTGGYDLQIFRASPGAKAMCDDPDRSHCTARRLADGSWLAVGRERLENAARGITYQVDLVRPDGAEFIMHVSNERSPKGASDVLGAHPPLTTRQMIAIVTSDLW